MRSALLEPRRLVIGTSAGLIVATALTLVLGAATKLPCMGTLDAGLLPHRYCYADVANLFVPRGLGRHIFPYVHGVMATSGTGNVFIGHGEIEYPVLTGIFVWLSALPVSTPGAFQVSTCLMLTPFGVLGAWSLWRMTGTRALYFVLTPAFVTYAFLNWDLIGLGLAMAALYMWQRDRPNWAAVLLALGTCAKLWPGLLLLPLITEYALINRRRAIHIAAIATATAALVNAPFILINPRGWYIPFEFQSRRGVSIDTNSLWYWDAHWLPTASVNALSTFAVAVGLLALLTWSVRCYHRSGTYPFLHVSAASVAWYLLAWKVYSPQYDLWLLPFFALVVYKRRIWISFVLADLLLYIWWLLAPPTTLDWLLALVVFWRAATVIWFIRASLTSTFSREHSEAYSSTGLIAHLLSR